MRNSNLKVVEDDVNEALRLIKMSKVNDIVSFCTTVDALNSRDVSLYTVTFSQVSLEDRSDDVPAKLDPITAVYSVRNHVHFYGQH